MLPPLSPAQEEALGAYEELLRGRGVELGLIAASDHERLGERHVRDSLRAAALLRDDDSIACDIGPGSGLPGVVLAIARPDVHMILIEPKQRAVGFLELVIDRLDLGNVEILAARVEDAHLQADVATARAFSSVQRSWEAAVRVLRPGGRLLYFAGERLTAPVETARSIVEPESPASVEAERVIADSSPIVMMTRRG